MTDPPAPHYITIGLKEIFVQIQAMSDQMHKTQGNHDLVVHEIKEIKCLLEKHANQIAAITSRPYISPAAVWTALGVIVAAAGVLATIIIAIVK